MTSKNILFGSFVLDIDGGLLLKDSVRVSIRPQALNALIYLAQNQGRIVTRKELGDVLWSGTNFDEDQSLNVLIRRLRDTLGDNTKNPIFIETIPRRGYRFIGTEVVADKNRDLKNIKPFSFRVAMALLVFLLAFYIYQGSSPDKPDPISVDALSPQARNQFLKGIMQFEKGNIDQSLKSFTIVSTSYPDFAEGHFWMAKTLERGHPVNSYYANLTRPYLEKALALSPDFSEALVKMGFVHLIADFDATRAASLARKALSLQPNNSEALNLLTMASLAMGDMQGAINSIKRVSDMDPGMDHIGTEGWVYFIAGDYETAARICRLSIQAGFGSEGQRNCMFESYLGLEEFDLALQQAAEIMELGQASENEISEIMTKDYNQALYLFHQWRWDHLKSNDYDFYERAIIDLRLGDPEAALQKLKVIVDEGRFPPIVLMPSDPRLDVLRGHPEADTVFGIFK